MPVLLTRLINLDFDNYNTSDYSAHNLLKGVVVLARIQCLLGDT